MSYTVATICITSLFAAIISGFGIIETNDSVAHRLTKQEKEHIWFRVFIEILKFICYTIIGILWYKIVLFNLK